jgi:hypothetical protein
MLNTEETFLITLATALAILPECNTEIDSVRDGFRREISRQTIITCPAVDSAEAFLQQTSTIPLLRACSLSPQIRFDFALFFNSSDKDSSEKLISAVLAFEGALAEPMPEKNMTKAINALETHISERIIEKIAHGLNSDVMETKIGCGYTHMVRNLEKK